MRNMIAVLLLMAASLAGCSRVETGSVGVMKHWGGEISTEAKYGFNLTILDSMIAEVDTTETRLPINDLRPADSNGVLLDDLDIIVSYRLEANKVPTFFIQTKELDDFVDDTGHHVTTVGMKILENMIKHAVQEQTKKQTLQTLAGNLTSYEEAIQKLAQAELDKGYPSFFHLIRINVNHFVPPQAILDQANRTASLKSEKERNAQELELIAQRTQLESQKAAVEATALREAIKATGLDAATLIAWKNARAYEALATSGMSVERTVQPIVPANNAAVVQK